MRASLRTCTPRRCCCCPLRCIHNSPSMATLHTASPAPRARKPKNPWTPKSTEKAKNMPAKNPPAKKVVSEDIWGSNKPGKEPATTKRPATTQQSTGKTKKQKTDERGKGMSLLLLHFFSFPLYHSEKHAGPITTPQTSTSSSTKENTNNNDNNTPSSAQRQNHNTTINEQAPAKTQTSNKVLVDITEKENAQSNSLQPTQSLEKQVSILTRLTREQTNTISKLKKAVDILTKKVEKGFNNMCGEMKEIEADAIAQKALDEGRTTYWQV